MLDVVRCCMLDDLYYRILMQILRVVFVHVYSHLIYSAFLVVLLALHFCFSPAGNLPPPATFPYFCSLLINGV